MAHVAKTRLVTPALLSVLALIAAGCGTTASETAANGTNNTKNTKRTQFAPTAEAELTDDAPESAFSDAASSMRRVTEANDGEDFDPTLSPDGAQVFFSSTRHSPSADIYMKTVDGSAVTQLTTHPAADVMPSVSPDGKRIAFASNRSGQWDIYVMSTEGGQAVQITSDAADELHPSWAPDGDRLTFCRLNESSERWEVWVTSTSKPNFRQYLTPGLFPTWQPNGDKIAFQRARDRGGRLFSVWTIDYTDGDAHRPTEVASSPEFAMACPAWSPDGTMIACISRPPTPAPTDTPADAAGKPTNGAEKASAVAANGANPDNSKTRTAAAHLSTTEPPVSESGAEGMLADIWVVTADGRTRANLTGGRYMNLTPAWGPTGAVYFVSDRAGTRNIWSLDARASLVAAGMIQSSNAPTANAMPASAAMPSHASEPAHAAAVSAPAAHVQPKPATQPMHSTASATVPAPAPVPSPMPVPEPTDTHETEPTQTADGAPDSSPEEPEHP
ncbi:MAG TPA: DPP IV N-terminal domain-containing protein [Phycisphaerales bacterium]|nr:DPP IV N-terminal domain-containing protein [Phycisphaerales bacterium]